MRMSEWHPSISNMICRAFCVCKAVTDPTSPSSVLYWVPLQDWQSLPRGLGAEQQRAALRALCLHGLPPEQSP